MADEHLIPSGLQCLSCQSVLPLAVRRSRPLNCNNVPTRKVQAMSEVVHSSEQLRNVTTDEAATILRNRVSWGAILAGVVVGLVVQIMLTVLGAGIGVATLRPAAGTNPAASTFSTVAGIWYVLSGLIGAYVGGYIAARMSGKTLATTGALHGLATWAVTTLVVLYFLTSTVGSIVGGAFSGISSALGGATNIVAQTASPMLTQSNPLEAIAAQVRATGTDPEALNNAAINAIRSLVMSDEATAPSARERAVQALAQARGIPAEQASQQIAQIEKQYHDAVNAVRQKAKQAADETASVVSGLRCAATARRGPSGQTTRRRAGHERSRTIHADRPVLARDVAGDPQGTRPSLGRDREDGRR